MFLYIFAFAEFIFTGSLFFLSKYPHLISFPRGNYVVIITASYSAFSEVWVWVPERHDIKMFSPESVLFSSKVKLFPNDMFVIKYQHFLK